MAPVLALIVGGVYGQSSGNVPSGLRGGRLDSSPSYSASALSTLGPAWYSLRSFPTATPSPTLTLPVAPAPSAPQLPVKVEPAGPMAAFSAGYRDAGGPPEYLDRLLAWVIPCEWGWHPWQPGNGYLSRAQFDPQSWKDAGGGNPSDDYTVGGNVARWIGMVDPGGSGGWPNCW